MSEVPVEQSPIAEPTPSKKLLIDSAVTFTEFLTSKYPQVDDGRVLRVKPVVGDDRVIKLPALPEGVETEARLNYYIAGSLGTMLLSEADSIEQLDGSMIPSIKVDKTLPIPATAKNIFANFARQIGDLDYVPTPYYIDSYSHGERLSKGGGGPAIAEIPEDAKRVLKIGENLVKLMCDPVSSYGDFQAVRIRIKGKDYYVASPDSILSYKILHLLMSHKKKAESTNRDFPIILEALTEIYGKERVLQSVYELLKTYEEKSAQGHEQLRVELQDKAGRWAQLDEKQRIAMGDYEYEPKMPKMISELLENDQVSSEVHDFVEELRSLDNSGTVFGKGQDAS